MGCVLAAMFARRWGIAPGIVKSPLSPTHTTTLVGPNRQALDISNVSSSSVEQLASLAMDVISSDPSTMGRRST